MDGRSTVTAAGPRGATATAERRRNELTVIDGSTVELTTSLRVGPTSSFVRWDFHDVGTYELTAASAATADGLLHDPNTAREMKVTDELTLGGGTLRLAEGLQFPDDDGTQYLEEGPGGTAQPKRFRMAIWERDGHAVYTFQYGGQPERMADVFAKFRLDTTPTGATARLLSDRGVDLIDGPGLMVDLGAIDLLEVVGRNRRRDRRLPKHAGTGVTGGELYIEAEDHDHTHVGPDGETIASPPDSFLLVSDSAIATTFQPRSKAQSTIDALAAIEVVFRRPEASLQPTGPR